MKTYSLEIFNNQHSFHYHCGSTAYFFPLLICDNKIQRSGTIEWIMRRDNHYELARGTVDAASPAAGCSGTLQEPGFLECEYIYTTDTGETISQRMGVGFDPENIQPSAALPDDFTEFWDKQLARLAQVPIQANEVLVQDVGSEDTQIQLWDVTVDCVDAVPVRGYLARPVHAKKKSHPIILSCHGAGVLSSFYHIPIQQALQGCISMNINAHGIENGKDDAFYNQLATGALDGYQRRGLDGAPENAYFTNMFLRVRRALDYLCQDPLWDQENVWLLGGSQGALQCFAGAYLDKRVSALAAGVAAGCDQTGFAIDRVSGWPQAHTLCDQENSTSDLATIYQTVRYFDTVNFARHITAPTIMNIGFIDLTCKPRTVYAAYNSLQGPKQIIENPLLGHEGRPDEMQASLSFLMGQGSWSKTNGTKIG